MSNVLWVGVALEGEENEPLHPSIRRSESWNVHITSTLTLHDTQGV